MSDNKRVLRIHVTKDYKDEKVNIRLPLALAKLARMGGVGESLSKRYGVDLDSVIRDIEELPDGKIIDVVDEKSGDHVELFVETRGVAEPAAV